MFSEVMRYILDLGPTVMLPIVIIIFSKEGANKSLI